MNIRRPLIGLSLFMVTATVLTWLVYATLRRDVAGPTTPYTAMFTDVFGLREGDDVRVAGVRIGRVEKIQLQGKLAKVDFKVQSDQQIRGDTIASVTYQNIVGQRYLGLSLGHTGDQRALPAHSVIPVERTDPSFDVGALLNGYEPLLSTLDPTQANNLTKAVIASLQGDGASLSTLIDQTSTLAKTFAGRDESLGAAINNLNTVVGNLSQQNDNLDKVIAQSRQVISELDNRRPALESSLSSIASVITRLSRSAHDVRPSLDELITREPGFATHLLGIEPQIAFLGANLPLVLKGLARMTNNGAYGNAYLCDLNTMGFFPGLNDVVPIIVNAATPGGKAWHTPRCRNLGNG